MKLKNNPFLLAALEEQKHIVAKADEFMALCDQFASPEQRQSNARLNAAPRTDVQFEV